MTALRKAAPKSPRGSPLEIDKRPPPDETIRAAVSARASLKPPGPPPPKARFREDGVISAPYSDDDLFLSDLKVTFGTQSKEFLDQCVGEHERATRNRGDDSAEFQRNPMPLNAGVAMVSAIAPRDELEAALALQMVATHHLSMELLARARHTGGLAATESYVGMSTKLERTFVAQVEALAKLRSAGKQVIEVQHVHVYPGGQAVVGTINHGGAPGGGDGSNPASTPGNALEHVLSSAVLGENAPRDALPVAGSQGAKTVSNARRQKPRCAKG